jgi:hypothetical protein
MSTHPYMFCVAIINTDLVTLFQMRQFFFLFYGCILYWKLTLGTNVLGSIDLRMLSQSRLLTSFHRSYFLINVGQHFSHRSQKDKINLWPQSAFPRHRDVPESHQRGYPRRRMREAHHHRRLGACPRNGLHFAQSKLLLSGFFSVVRDDEPICLIVICWLGHTLYQTNEKCDRQRAQSLKMKVIDLGNPRAKTYQRLFNSF